MKRVEPDASLTGWPASLARVTGRSI